MCRYRYESRTAAFKHGAALEAWKAGAHAVANRGRLLRLTASSRKTNETSDKTNATSDGAALAPADAGPAPEPSPTFAKPRSVNGIERLLRHGQRWDPQDAPAARLRHYESELLGSLREGAKTLRDVGWIRERAASYELSCAWWDVVEYARKALVTGAMMLFPQGSALQLIVGVLILVGFLASLVRLEPYKAYADDVLAIVSQVVVLLALLLGLWLTSLVDEAESERLREGKTESSDGESYNSSKYAHINALLVINSAVPLLLAAALLFYELRVERRHHRRHHQGHHHLHQQIAEEPGDAPEDEDRPPSSDRPAAARAVNVKREDGVSSAAPPPVPTKRAAGPPERATPPARRRHRQQRRPHTSETNKARATPPSGASSAGGSGSSAAEAPRAQTVGDEMLRAQSKKARAQLPGEAIVTRV